MNTLKLTGIIHSNNTLSAKVPEGIASGPVEFYLVVPVKELEQDDDWMGLVTESWAAELADPLEDIYTLEDGMPINAAR